MIPEISKSIQFSLYGGVHFLDTKLCPFGVQKKWFYCTYFHIEAPNSANYDFICFCYFAFFPPLCFQCELKWDSHSYFQVSR